MVAVIVRFIIQLRIRKPFSLDDFFILLALVALTGSMILLFVGILPIVNRLALYEGRRVSDSADISTRRGFHRLRASALAVDSC